MDVARIVGSSVVRLATAGFALVCLLGIWLYRDGMFPRAGRLVLWLTIAAGVVATIGLIHCSRAVYAHWLAFSRRLHSVMVTVLFGASYLLLVPVFRLIALVRDPLRLGRRSRRETFWIQRREESDPASLERMG